MISKKMTIVSDTSACNLNGINYAYEPVLKEVNYFAKLFKSITWLTYKDEYKNTIYSHRIPSNVRIVFLDYKRKTNLFSKLITLFKYPLIFFKIYKYCKDADVIHSRAPSHPSLLLLLVSFFLNEKIFWHKYAGSWVDNAPFIYRIQRNLLKFISKRKNQKVTINGNWEGLNKNILPFENPSFSSSLRNSFFSLNEEKEFEKPYKVIYVGALSKFKGVHLIIEALNHLKFKDIVSFKIIGNGTYESELKNLVKRLEIENKVDFLGKLGKNRIFEILSNSDFLLFASKTEGFPKVISESMMNGCIPISTSVSCINQYVNNDTGFIIPNRNIDSIARSINLALSTDKKRLKKISQNCIEMSSIFTYEYYIERLTKLIFK